MAQKKTNSSGTKSGSKSGSTKGTSGTGKNSGAKKKTGTKTGAQKKTSTRQKSGGKKTTKKTSADTRPVPVVPAAEIKKAPGKNGKAAPGAASGEKEERKPLAGNKMRDDILAVVMAAAGIFLILSVMTSLTGRFGETFSLILKGLFGLGAFILPFFLIAYAILVLIGRMAHINLGTFFFTTVLFLDLNLLNSARFAAVRSGTFGLRYMKSMFVAGTTLQSSGLIGMTLAWPIVHFMDLAGLIIAGLVIMVIAVMMIVDTPISVFFYRQKERRLQRRLERQEQKRIAEEEDFIRRAERLEAARSAEDARLAREWAEASEPQPVVYPDRARRGKAGNTGNTGGSRPLYADGGLSDSPDAAGTSQVLYMDDDLSSPFDPGELQSPYLDDALNDAFASGMSGSMYADDMADAPDTGAAPSSYPVGNPAHPSRTGTPQSRYTDDDLADLTNLYGKIRPNTGSAGTPPDDRADWSVRDSRQTGTRGADGRDGRIDAGFGAGDSPNPSGAAGAPGGNAGTARNGVRPARPGMSALSAGGGRRETEDAIHGRTRPGFSGKDGLFRSFKEFLTGGMDSGKKARTEEDGSSGGQGDPGTDSFDESIRVFREAQNKNTRTGQDAGVRPLTKEEKAQRQILDYLQDETLFDGNDREDEAQPVPAESVSEGTPVTRRVSQRWQEEFFEDYESEEEQDLFGDDGEWDTPEAVPTVPRATGRPEQGGSTTGSFEAGSGGNRPSTDRPGKTRTPAGTPGTVDAGRSRSAGTEKRRAPESGIRDPETGSGVDTDGTPRTSAREPVSKAGMKRAIEEGAAAVGAVVEEKKEPAKKVYQLPPYSLLRRVKNHQERDEGVRMRAKGAKLEAVLKSFGVDARVINVQKGPSVTRYEIQPAPGVKVNSIVRLADDIALNLEAKSLRIEAPIPGKAAIGIEIQNDSARVVTIREMVESQEFRNAKSKISFVVGEDISGKSVVADLKTMPHLLIAGSTGSGKSVCINSMILSILYNATPDEVRLILIDPKVVELGNYNGIPHMLIPVVTDPSRAAAALAWAVKEMSDRYQKFAETQVRDLAAYNGKMRREGQPDLVMPQIVIIIDELADLMMAAPKQVEESICRLAQLARAAGMHLVVATQRPSVDIVTGLIKANVPSRIAFAVSSQVDSRTILDRAGAEKLVGKGDMLFYPLGKAQPERLQGPFVTDDEVSAVIEFWKNQADGDASQTDQIMEQIDSAMSLEPTGDGDGNEEDELLEDAVDLVLETRQASASMLQRRFRIGYNRAGRLVDVMEARGVIGPSEGSKPRKVLMSREEYDMKFYGIPAGANAGRTAEDPEEADA